MRRKTAASGSPRCRTGTRASKETRSGSSTAARRERSRCRSCATGGSRASSGRWRRGCWFYSRRVARRCRYRRSGGAGARRRSVAGCAAARGRAAWRARLPCTDSDLAAGPEQPYKTGPMPSEIASGQTTEGLPVAPSLGPALLEARVPPERALVDARVVFICALSIVIAAAAGVVAQALTRLIGFVTNLAFYGRVSSVFVSPAANRLGPLVILVPIAGAVVVGLMARYGSAAIRGHGIPEAMEQVLLNKSRIPARVTVLKPVSAAISIGTGGPFGAEGPIIATGGALGSLLGQLLHTTAVERKTLLAAGAAAGMTATFGSPVSAVLLAVARLLFELRPRSLIPVALAAAAATAVRIAFVGIPPAFGMPNIAQPGEAALTGYVRLGALVGVVSVGVTKLVYWVEDVFDHLPIHWMWWPAIGAVAVGICGYFSPHTLGVGYDNIDHILSAEVAGEALLFLGGLKF